MTKQLTHAKVSGKSDGGDPTQVLPSDWNDNHEGLQLALSSADQALDDASLVDVTDLELAIGANETWIFTVWIQVQGITADDVKFAFTGPSGASFVWAGDGLTTGAAVNTDFAPGGVQTGDDATNPFGLLTGSKISVTIRGCIVNGANAGTLKLRAAKVADTGADTNIYAKSWIKGERVA